MLSSKGAAGVTGAGFITLASTLSIVPDVPVAGMALILGVDRFMSECRSLTNFMGNAVATVVVARWEGALDRTRLDAGDGRQSTATGTGDRARHRDGARRMTRQKNGERRNDICNPIGGAARRNRLRRARDRGAWAQEAPAAASVRRRTSGAPMPTHADTDARTSSSSARRSRASSVSAALPRHRARSEADRRDRRR